MKAKRRESAAASAAVWGEPERREDGPRRKINSVVPEIKTSRKNRITKLRAGEMGAAGKSKVKMMSVNATRMDLDSI